MSKRFLCKQCILPSTFPGISFNEKGVCNHCQRYKGEDATTALQEKYEKKFLKLLDEKKNEAGYSSNCTLNAFANQVHRIKYDFHPYAWEISNVVRTGVLTRDEGIEKIEPPEDNRMVVYSQKKLGVS